MFEPRRNGLSIVFVVLIYDAVSLTTYFIAPREKWDLDSGNTEFLIHSFESYTHELR